jgi:hypothetical protein
MKSSTTYLAIAMLLAVSLSIVPAGAASETMVSGADVSRTVSVRDVTVKGNTVTGTLVNHSSRTLRDVELLIRHEWLWKDEQHPGAESPSTAAYHTVHEELPPNGSVHFTYSASWPPTQRTDGHFDTSVQVIGFVEVG